MFSTLDACGRSFHMGANIVICPTLRGGFIGNHGDFRMNGCCEYPGQSVQQTNMRGGLPKQILRCVWETSHCVMHVHHACLFRGVGCAWRSVCAHSEQDYASTPRSSKLPGRTSDGENQSAASPGTAAGP
eukprot:24403-Prymnesium_polylepis.1